MNKISSTILMLIIVSYSICHASNKNSFIPWKANVTIADENFNIKDRSKNQNPNIYNALSGAAYFLIRFFQIVISPQDGPSCRFKPVCSVYGRIAIQRFGALPGAMLAGDRILRCNPISPPGEDPVPYTIFGE